MADRRRVGLCHSRAPWRQAPISILTRVEADDNLCLPPDTVGARTRPKHVRSDTFSRLGLLLPKSVHFNLPLHTADQAYITIVTVGHGRYQTTCHVMSPWPRHTRLSICVFLHVLTGLFPINPSLLKCTHLYVQLIYHAES